MTAMHSRGFVVIVISYLTGKTLSQDDLVTKLSGPSHVCLGSSVELTCDISMEGKVDQTIWYRPDNIVVMTCTKDNNCFPVSPNYEMKSQSPNRQVLRIVKFNQEDAGNWTCNAGPQSTRPLLVQALESPVVSKLVASCSKDTDTKKFLVTCTGLSARGSPPVSLLLSSNVRAFANVKSDNLSYSSLQEGLTGAKITCALSGSAAQCVNNVPISVTTKCPGHIPWVLIIIGIVCGLIVVFIIVDLLRCRTKQAGLFYFLKGKCGGGSSFSPKPCSKAEKQDGANLESGTVENKPLMTDKNESQDAEKTGGTADKLLQDEKGDGVKMVELEPEDKDPTTVKEAPQPKPRTVKPSSTSTPPDEGTK